jgi:hypothetical protein
VGYFDLGQYWCLSHKEKIITTGFFDSIFIICPYFFLSRQVNVLTLGFFGNGIGVNKLKGHALAPLA